MNRKQLKTIADVGRATGIPQSTIWHWIKFMKIAPEPTIQLGNRKYYDIETYDRVVADLKEGK